MPNLALKIEEIEKEMSVNAQGVVTFSIHAVARILSIDESSLRNVFKQYGRKVTHKLAKTLIAMGFDMRDFAINGVPDIALGIIANYYANQALEKHRTEEAKLANMVFSAIGVRKWGQEVLGWKPSTQNTESKLLLAIEGLTTTVNQMRDEMNNQNERINLLLPIHEMMQRIKPALFLNNGTVLDLMQDVSQNLNDFPTQQHHEIKYFLEGRKCTVGERISIGQTVSSSFKGVIGIDLPTKYGYKRSNKLYPECAKPIFELVLRGMGK